MRNFSLHREKRTDSGHPPDHTVLLSHINKYVTTQLLITCPELKFHQGCEAEKPAEKQTHEMSLILIQRLALNVHFNALNHLKNAATSMGRCSFVSSPNAVLVGFRRKHTECA